jgi:hypothetical protein
MHQNEGRTIAADGVTKPRAAPLERALLESLEAVFAVRHL